MEGSVCGFVGGTRRYLARRTVWTSSGLEPGTSPFRLRPTLYSCLMSFHLLCCLQAVVHQSTRLSSERLMFMRSWTSRKFYPKTRTNLIVAKALSYHS